jgi:hypothetical protein
VDFDFEPIAAHCSQSWFPAHLGVYAAAVHSLVALCPLGLPQQSVKPLVTLDDYEMVNMMSRRLLCKAHPFSPRP